MKKSNKFFYCTTLKKRVFSGLCSVIIFTNTFVVNAYSAPLNDKVKQNKLKDIYSSTVISLKNFMNKYVNKKVLFCGSVVVLGTVGMKIYCSAKDRKKGSISNGGSEKTFSEERSNEEFKNCSLLYKSLQNMVKSEKFEEFLSKNCSNTSSRTIEILKFFNSNQGLNENILFQKYSALGINNNELEKFFKEVNSVINSLNKVKTTDNFIKNTSSEVNMDKKEESNNITDSTVDTNETEIKSPIENKNTSTESNANNEGNSVENLPQNNILSSSAPTKDLLVTDSNNDNSSDDQVLNSSGVESLTPIRSPLLLTPDHTSGISLSSVRSDGNSFSLMTPNKGSELTLRIPRDSTDSELSSSMSSIRSCSGRQLHAESTFVEYLTSETTSPAISSSQTISNSQNVANNPLQTPEKTFRSIESKLGPLDTPVSLDRIVQEGDRLVNEQSSPLSKSSTIDDGSPANLVEESINSFQNTSSGIEVNMLDSSSNDSSGNQISVEPQPVVDPVINPTEEMVEANKNMVVNFFNKIVSDEFDEARGFNEALFGELIKVSKVLKNKENRDSIKEMVNEEACSNYDYMCKCLSYSEKSSSPTVTGVWHIYNEEIKNLAKEYKSIDKIEDKDVVGKASENTIINNITLLALGKVAAQWLCSRKAPSYCSISSNIEYRDQTINNLLNDHLNFLLRNTEVERSFLIIVLGFIEEEQYPKDNTRRQALINYINVNYRPLIMFETSLKLYEI